MTGPGTDMIICIQYCVISIVCVFLLIYCIIVTNRSAEHSSELLFYKLTMGFAVLCSFMDMMFALREYGRFPLGDSTNYISEILYSLGSILGTYSWFIYSEKKQQSPISASRKRILLCAVPFAVMSIFTITTPLHRLCFSVVDSQYIRGILNVPFTGICIAFIAFSGIMALLKSFRKEFHSRVAFLRFLFLYALLLTAAQLLQVYVGPILPFRSLSAAVLFVFVTLHGMCETVTIDAGSQVNNRFSLNRLLDARLMSKEKFWLTMIDVDDFKHINDSYGHIKGDEAIFYTASAILRTVPRSSFVARYGGDEFAVVSPFEDEPLVRSMEEKIRDELQGIVQENHCPFSIDISVGYAPRTDSINNIPDMVEAADRMLYERKRGKKAAAEKE